MLLLILFNFILSVTSQESWLVSTEYGNVRGFWSDQYNVWQFLGMPFAASPVQENRYKHPLPPASWSDEINATDNTIFCTQNLVMTSNTQTEDCLIMNVYAPSSARNGATLPVLFFVHGGGFTYGSSNTYNPYLTTRHDVILVTANYRLGPLGYLCLGTQKVPGNAALRDIVEALRWTNRNIARFGGDPNAVTIYGESAGAVNTESLVLSKATNGLFQRAIIESGSALSPWVYNYNRLGLAKAQALNMGLNHVDDVDRLAQFFEDADASDIIQSIAVLNNRHSVCAENNIDGIETIVGGVHKSILETGDYNKVPILFAYAYQDGSVHSGSFYGDINNLQNNFAHFIPTDLTFETESEKNTVAQTLKTFYFGNAAITADSILQYVQFATDYSFFGPMYRSAMKNAVNSDNPIYLMEFSYRGGFNQPTSIAEIQGAAHADIVAHVMDLGHFNNNTLAEDQVVRDLMTAMWTNFVKYGNPTPDNSLPVRWLPFTPDQQYYLSMGQEMSLLQNPRSAAAQLWTEIYNKYYYPPPLFVSSADRSTVCLVFLLLCVYLNIAGKSFFYS